MELMLGSAQFGGRLYGIANKNGVIPKNTVFDILNMSVKRGISGIDTGNDYGESEKIIGEAQSRGINFNITSKQYFLKEQDYTIDNFKKSLNNMQVRKVNTILVHNTNLFTDLVFSNLMSAKSLGLTDFMGVSVGAVAQANYVIGKYPIDVIQFPCNVFNQTFYKSGLLGKCKDLKIQTQARSIFLQGLLLLDTDDLSNYFFELHPKIILLKECAKENNISVYRLAIEYIKSLDVDKIIIGVNNIDHVNELISEFNKPRLNINFDEFSVEDERFIDTGKWPVGGWL